MWLACPGVIKENHSEYCPGVLPSIQGKVGVEGYPGNVINIQDMSNKETLQQLWKKRHYVYFSPPVYISAKFYSCGTIMTPLGGPPPPYQHIRIGTHSSGRTYNAMCWGENIVNVLVK